MSAWIDEFDLRTDDDYLNIVMQTASWLADHEHHTEEGIFWDVIADKTNSQDAVLTSEVSLYGGNAGISLFFLRLYESTGDKDHLNRAIDGIRYAYRHIRESDYRDSAAGTLKGIAGGLYNGPAGVGFVSYLIYKLTGNEESREIAQIITDKIISSSASDEDGICWSGAYGILSDGGLILYLIWLFEQTGNSEYLELAEKAGRRIANKAETVTDGRLSDKGVRWYAMDSEAFGLGPKGYFPGFFYGTAGTGYIMAKLYQHTKDERFLNLAKGAAAYITSIAEVTEDSRAALVRYNDPYKPDLYYLGVCQGPAGTSRLFYLLYRLTDDITYKEWVIRLTEGIINTGAPKIHSKGYWHTYNYCCGAAGMAEHFLAIYALTGEERYREQARTSVEILIGDSVEDDGKRCWYSAWNRHAPDEVEAWSGLYVGSAGAASAILAFYNMAHDIRSLAGYIEDPFEK